jgi:hypothetical protein
LLNKLSKGCDRFRASLYADDAAVFIKPSAREVVVTEHILGMFARASGLVTNLNKIEFLLDVRRSTSSSLLITAGIWPASLVYILGCLFISKGLLEI